MSTTSIALPPVGVKRLTEFMPGILRRHKNHSNRSIILKIPPPTLENYKEAVIRSVNDGFSCYYCKKPLKIRDIKPYFSVWSIDHKIPYALGGDNKTGNIAICCYACNIIKGTMTADTYSLFLSAVGSVPGLLNRIINETFQGKQAEKYWRIKAERGTNGQ